MLRSLRRLVFAVSVAVLVLTLATGYVWEQFVRQEESCVLTISYDNEVIYVLQGILVSLQRAESSRRGYVITTNREYVSNYNDAVNSVQHSMAYLKRLNSNGQYQDSFLDSLGSSITTRLVDLKKSIELEMADSAADSAQAVITNQGVDAMASLRSTILILERQKRDSQDDAFQKIGNLNASGRSLMTALLSGSVVVLLGFAYLSVLLLRRLERYDDQMLRELYYARQQAQHFSTRYQDLKAETKEKKATEDSVDPGPQ
ncbi:MAG TPA: CHASE3 domain-containing protein [Bacteroidota bacterium]|nr:CHASE3 domain-containing protein [Bacteroidota bacterium]